MELCESKIVQFDYEVSGLLVPKGAQKDAARPERAMRHSALVTERQRLQYPFADASVYTGTHISLEKLPAACSLALCKKAASGLVVSNFPARPRKDHKRICSEECMQEGGLVAGMSVPDRSTQDKYCLRCHHLFRLVSCRRT